MNRTLRRAAPLAGLTLAAALFAGGSPAQAASCGGQNLRVTHSSNVATLTVYGGLCGRHYQVWASDGSGHSYRGAWVTQGHQSNIYDPSGGLRIGGWNRRVDATGYITRHTSFG